MLNKVDIPWVEWESLQLFPFGLLEESEHAAIGQICLYIFVSLFKGQTRVFECLIATVSLRRAESCISAVAAAKS